MTKPVISILQQVRTDAARDALQTSRANEHDAWFQDGREQGWGEGNAERGRWGWFCFLCGIAVSALFYGLVLS
jgi:hypothetical protein